MISRRSSVWLGPLLLLASSAMAAETFGKGVAVARELVDPDGHRFAVTVTPPADRAVDRRFMDSFEISAVAPAGRAGKTSSESAAAAARRFVTQAAARKVAGEPDEDPIDVSGYQVEIELLSLATCSAEIRIAKSKPATLARGAFVTTRVTGAASMSIVAFPTSGDVDVGVLVNDTQECAISEKPKSTLDVVSCTKPDCNPQRDSLLGVIANTTNSTAKYVGVFTILFSN